MSDTNKLLLFQLLTDIAIGINNANTLEQGAGSTIDKICAFMGWPVGQLYLCPRDSSEELIFMPLPKRSADERFQAFENESYNLRFSKGAGLPGKVWALQERFWIEDLAESPDFRRADLARAVGFKMGLAFPLCVDTSIVGVVEFFAFEINKPEGVVLDLMAQVGTQLGRLIERKHNEDALRQSEERFRLLIEGVRDYAIFMLDQKGHVATWNEGAKRFKGYEAHEIIGRHFSKFYPEEDLRNGKPAFELREAAAIGRFEDEGWRVRKDGSLFWANVIITAMRNREGKLIGYSKVTRDLTERKRAEDALRASEMKFRAVAESASDAIISVDNQGAVLSWNRGAELLFGYQSSDIVGQSLIRLLPSKDHAQFEKNLQQFNSANQPDAIPEILQLEGVKRNGKRFPVEVAIGWWRQDGRFYFSGVIRDITKRKEAEKKMLQLNAELERRVQERTLALERANRAVQDEILQHQRAEEARIKLLSQAEKSRRQSSFLAEASALLGSSLDYEQTLASIARLSVPFFADYCVIDIATADQQLKRVKIAHFDPDKERIVIELSRLYPPKRDDHGPYKVFRTNTPQMLTDIPDALLVDSAEDETHLQLLRALKLRSYICVPMRSPSQTLGVITFIASESERRYGPEDMVLAEELARRCAFAVDHARLYELAQKEIQERISAQESLAAEKERLAVTLYSIGDGVITTDTAGNVVLLNKVAEQLTGWSRQKALGKPIDEIFQIVDGRTRQPHDNPIRQVLKGAAFSLPRHATLMAQDGSERVIADSGAPIHDEKGKVVGAVLVFRDVTNERKMEEELLRTRNLESVGVLAGGIAHDFNNIMTAILGNVSLAKICIGAENDAYQVLLETEKAFARARDLTQQLLTFAKGGAPVKQTASISELIAHTTQFSLRGSNIRYELEFSKDLYPVDFDTGQLSQAIGNIVINAMQAMPDSGMLKITGENVEFNESNGYLPRGRYVKLLIQDTGMGIPEQYLSKIFDPYFTTKQQGTGLGLATTYSIIKQHGGQIEVESAVNKGTTFTVYLPAADPASLLKAEAGYAEKKVYRGRGKVLIMDDDEEIRIILERQLHYLGYEVSVASNGKQAVALYKKAGQSGRPFDAVILDLTVPGGMGGKECIAKLKAIDQNVKAIVSSGYFTDPVMAEYEKYGFQKRIAKPYQIEDLSKTLYELVTSKARAEERSEDSQRA